MVTGVKDSLKLAVLTVMAALSLSCYRTEELVDPSEEVETIEITDNEGVKVLKVSSVLENVEEWPFENVSDSLMLKLQSIDESSNVQKLWMSYTKSGDNVNYSLYIPMGSLLNDGCYKLLKTTDCDGNETPHRLKMTFSGRKLIHTETAAVDYKLQGEGTAASPYKINSITSLINFAGTLQIDEFHAHGLYFKLFADIDMTEYYSDPFRVMDQGWCGIGGGFGGHFDGGGYTISNLKYSSSETSDIGLFKELMEGAAIVNLNLSLVNIMAAKDNVGALAGKVTGNVTVDSVIVNGNIKAVGSYCGGLVGKVDKGKLVVRNCTLNSGNVEAQRYCGGLVGGVQGEIVVENCRNKALNVEAISTDAGGFVGILHQGDYSNKITGSESYAAVSGNQSAGGIVGQSSGLEMSDVYVQADKIIATTSYCGGLVGYNVGNLQIDSCTVFHSSSENYTENVIGSSSTDGVGGFVGYSTSSVGEFLITSGEVISPVEGKNNVGGFVGYLTGPLTLKSSVVSGSAQIKGYSRVGGFVGYSTGGALNITDMCEQRSNVTGIKGKVGGAIGEAVSAIMDNVYINAVVTGGDFYIGGAVGYGDKLSLKSLIIGSGVRVDGPNDVGGVVGRVLNTNFDNKLFKEPLKIIVCGNTDYSTSALTAGGVAGSAQGCKFNGISVECSVYGKQSIGGITGYDDGSSYENCSFDGLEVVAAGSDAGGIVGRSVSASVKFNNLVNNGKVKGASHTGGIVGEVMNAGLSNCTNNGKVEGGQDTGGIVGRMDNDNGNGGVTLSDCINKGTVTAGKRCLGGICGYVESGKDNSRSVTFSKCFNGGTIQGTGSGSGNRDGMGGILGEGKYSIIIRNCGNKGTVEGSTGFHHIGGIAGYLGENSKGLDNYIKIEQCYNMGTVGVTSLSEAVYVGGIAGHLEDSRATQDNVQISDCFNLGRVKAMSSEEEKYHAGGMVGKASYYLSVLRCYTGKELVSSLYKDGAYYRAAGIAGCHADAETAFNSWDIENCYTENGTAWDEWWGKPNKDWSSYFNKSERESTSTFSGFSFGTVWGLSKDLNGGYPYLLNTSSDF